MKQITIKADPQNPNRMEDSDKERMALSLAEFGDLGGIVINKRTGLLIGGHQRVSVLGDSLEIEELKKQEPDGTVGRGWITKDGRRYAVRVVDWDEAKAHAALLAANRFGRVGKDDTALLKDMLEELDTGAVNMDLTGYVEAEIERLMLQEHQEEDNKYTNKIVAPVYEPKGERPPLDALMDRTKTKQLIAEIDAAGIPPDVAEFLRFAAERHTVFNFRQIAEYYCHADATLQDLIERSGMVIIDFKKAIEYGFVHLTEKLGELADLEEGEEDA